MRDALLECEVLRRVGVEIPRLREQMKQGGELFVERHDSLRLA